jgi:peptide/nickel transport system substrate-binding protein
VDNLTINITPKAQNLHFPTVILESDLNWVAKPAALQAGQTAFDANPIGAGPFTLQSWKRSDVITLVKNPKYWDAPKPYLDAMQVRSIPDYNTRWNTMSSGAADFDDESNWANVVKAQKAGTYTVTSLDYGGGTALGLNTTRAPFNDVRARKALAAALDLTLVDQALYGTSTGQIPTTFFAKGSPYYANIPLQTQNQKQAQDLFDQYAAATGQPVTFTISLVSASSQPVADSVITQLSAYKNVKVTSKVVDIAQYGTIVSKRDFDAFTVALTPTRTGLNLLSTSAGNTTGIKDPAIDAAIGTLYTNPDEAAIKAAWVTIQKQLADQVPYIFYARLSLTAITTKKVNGVTHYGFGSVPADTIWMSS